MGIRIVNLGDIVTQDQMKSLSAFANLISPVGPEAVMGRIGSLLTDKGTRTALDEFKLGTQSEAKFTEFMIRRLHETFAEELAGRKITTEEFDKAWNAMNPLFKSFRDTLNEMIGAQIHHDIVLVSFTNPKDMWHLVGELQRSGMPCTLGPDNELLSIADIPLYKTYSERKSKAELIQDLVIQFGVKPQGTSPQSFFPQGSATIAPDIKYVRGIHSSTDPLVVALSKTSDEEVGAATATLGIETLFWKKAAGQGFQDAIRGSDVYVVPAAKL